MERRKSEPLLETPCQAQANEAMGRGYGTQR